MVAFWLELALIKDQNCLVVPYLKYRKLNFNALSFSFAGFCCQLLLQYYEEISAERRPNSLQLLISFKTTTICHVNCYWCFTFPPVNDVSWVFLCHVSANTLSSET